MSAPAITHSTPANGTTNGPTPFSHLDTEFLSPPQTQGSQISDGYQPYSVDEQDAPDGRYGWATEQGSGSRGIGGSQTPEDNPSARPPHPLPRSVPTHSRGGEIHVRTAYTPPEREKMFKAYMKISEDPETGTNQTGERFWWPSLAGTMTTDREEHRAQREYGAQCHLQSQQRNPKVPRVLPSGTTVGGERHERGRHYHGRHVDLPFHAWQTIQAPRRLVAGA